MKEKLRKLILNWLFGTDNVERYMEVLGETVLISDRYVKELNAHLKTMEENRDNLITIKKLVKVCENHGIDPDKEICKIKLYDEDFKGE